MYLLAFTLSAMLSVLCFIVSFASSLTSAYTAWAAAVREGDAAADVVAEVLRAMRTERDVTYVTLLLSHALAAPLLAGTPPVDRWNGTAATFTAATLHNNTAIWACLLQGDSSAGGGMSAAQCDAVQAAYVWRDADAAGVAQANVSALRRTILTIPTGAARNTDAALQRLAQSSTACRRASGLLGDLGVSQSECASTVTATLLNTVPVMRRCNGIVMRAFVDVVLPELATAASYSPSRAAALRNASWTYVASAAPECVDTMLSSGREASSSSQFGNEALAGTLRAVTQSPWLLSYQKSVAVFDGSLSTVLQLVIATRLSYRDAINSFQSPPASSPLALTSLTTAGRLVPFANTLAADINRLEFEVSRLRGHVTAALFAGAFIDLQDTFNTRGALYTSGKLLLPYLVTRSPSGATVSSVLPPNSTWHRRLLIGPSRVVAQLPPDSSILYGTGTRAHADVGVLLRDAAASALSSSTGAAGISATTLGASITSDMTFIMNTTETLLRWRLFMSDIGVSTVILPPSEVEGFTWLRYLSGAEGPTNSSSAAAFAASARYLDDTSGPMFGSPMVAPAKYFLVCSRLLVALEGLGSAISGVVNRQLEDADRDGANLLTITIVVSVLLLACLLLGAWGTLMLLRRQAAALLHEHSAKISMTLSSISADRLRDPVNGLVTVAEMLRENLLVNVGSIHSIASAEPDALGAWSSHRSRSGNSVPGYFEGQNSIVHPGRRSSSREGVGGRDGSRTAMPSSLPLAQSQPHQGTVVSIDTDTKEQMELVRSLEMCASSLRALVRDLNDFAALFTGRGLLTRTTTLNLRSDMVEILANTARKLWLQESRMALQESPLHPATQTSRRTGAAGVLVTAAGDSAAVPSSGASSGRDSTGNFVQDDYCMLDVDEPLPDVVRVDGERVRQLLEVILAEVAAAGPWLHSHAEDDAASSHLGLRRLRSDDPDHMLPYVVLRVGFRPTYPPAWDAIRMGGTDASAVSVPTAASSDQHALSENSDNPGASMPPVHLLTRGYTTTRAPLALSVAGLAARTTVAGLASSPVRASRGATVAADSAQPDAQPAGAAQRSRGMLSGAFAAVSANGPKTFDGRLQSRAHDPVATPRRGVELTAWGWIPQLGRTAPLLQSVISPAVSRQRSSVDAGRATLSTLGAGDRPPLHRVPSLRVQPSSAAEWEARACSGAISLTMFLAPEIGDQIVSKYAERKRSARRDGDDDADDLSYLFDEASIVAMGLMPTQLQSFGGLLGCITAASASASWSKDPSRSSDSTREDAPTMRVAQSLPFCGAIVRALGGRLLMQRCNEPYWSTFSAFAPGGVAASRAASRAASKAASAHAPPPAPVPSPSPRAVKVTNMVAPPQATAPLPAVLSEAAAAPAGDGDLTEHDVTGIAALPFTFASSAQGASYLHRDSTIDYGQGRARSLQAPRKSPASPPEAGAPDAADVSPTSPIDGPASPVITPPASPIGDANRARQVGALDAATSARQVDGVRAVPGASRWYRIRIVIPCRAIPPAQLPLVSSANSAPAPVAMNSRGSTVPPPSVPTERSATASVVQGAFSPARSGTAPLVVPSAQIPSQPSSDTRQAIAMSTGAVDIRSSAGAAASAEAQTSPPLLTGVSPADAADDVTASLPTKAHVSEQAASVNASEPAVDLSDLSEDPRPRRGVVAADVRGGGEVPCANSPSSTPLSFRTDPADRLDVGTPARGSPSSVASSVRSGSLAGSRPATSSEASLQLRDVMASEETSDELDITAGPPPMAAATASAAVNATTHATARPPFAVAAEPPAVGPASHMRAPVPTRGPALLPVATVRGVPAPAIPSRAAPAARRRALIVDEDEVGRGLAARILDTGCRLESATLERVEEVVPWCVRAEADGRGFEVILIDALLRRQSPRAILEQLRAAGLRMPVLLMADKSYEHTEADVRGFGFAGVLPKPLSRVIVTSIVMRLLAQ